MIINEVAEHLVGMKEGVQTTLTAHSLLMLVHIKALACHAECLGMNAENSIAVCENSPPIYHDKDYYAVMDKWELTKDGRVII